MEARIEGQKIGGIERISGKDKEMEGTERRLGGKCRREWKEGGIEGEQREKVGKELS